MTQEKKQEYTLRITQANKTQMITILYEMVIDYICDAKAAMTLAQYDIADRNLGYAQNVVDELIRSVNRKYELGRLLHRLYIFSKKELTAAGVQKSVNRLSKVEQNFRALHAAYKEIENEDTSAPTMGNIQTVYAGLTYGKYSLNEEVASSSYNRGFMA
ncbi:flagellar export chaperone FliS [Butyrivibrio sp. VCB2006]|uniref:flagellar export chaperone FliS n=1 Tax=Butyrivibrio sp. VCB2006 TaxID=1280679 RepID=UPI00040B3CCE|nr:flagellar protein FliS [Butyrivibrio sp. VCB2006]